MFPSQCQSITIRITRIRKSIKKAKKSEKVEKKRNKGLKLIFKVCFCSITIIIVPLHCQSITLGSNRIRKSFKKAKKGEKVGEKWHKGLKLTIKGCFWGIAIIMVPLKCQSITVRKWSEKVGKSQRKKWKKRKKSEKSTTKAWIYHLGSLNIVRFNPLWDSPSNMWKAVVVERIDVTEC